MAIIKNGFTRGTIGHTSYSERNGVQIVKGLSEKPKYNKTTGTINSSTVFGKASTLANYFRISMYDVYNGLHDGGMSVRLTGLVNQCFRPALDETNLNFNFKPNTFERLIGFNFNIISPFEKYMFSQPLVEYTSDNRVHISIAEMNLPRDFIFPSMISKCKIVLTCGLFDLENGFYTDQQSQLFDIGKNNPTTIIPEKSAAFHTQPGCLCMMGISLQYYKTTFAGDIITNNKQFNPSAILSAQITDGMVDRSVTKKWNKMDFKVGRQLTLPPPAPAQLLLGSPNYTAI
ncbi:MAG: hypothetical protein WKF66_02030 [Pedobacter sp.]